MSTIKVVLFWFLFIGKLFGILAMPQINLEYKPIKPTYFGETGGTFVGQIIPPGKPWPASAEDYTSTPPTQQTTQTTASTTPSIPSRIKETTSTEPTTPTTPRTTTSTAVSMTTAGESSSNSPTTTSTTETTTSTSAAPTTRTPSADVVVTTEQPSTATHGDELFTSPTQVPTIIPNIKPASILVSSLLPMEAEKVLTMETTTRVTSEPTTVAPSTTEPTKKECDCKKPEIIFTIHGYMEPNFGYHAVFSPFNNMEVPPKYFPSRFPHHFYRHVI